MSGALVRTFGSSAELNAPIAVAFDGTGDVYVTSAVNHRLVRYDGASGALEGVVAQGGLLSNPADMKRGPDGRLYIASVLQNRIAVWDTNNATMSSYVQDAFFEGPVGLTFGPNNDLFVASFGGDKVVRVDRITQTITDNLISPQSGGLDGAQYVAFIPEPGSIFVMSVVPMMLRARRRPAE
jgi:streptogramin lyase